MHRVASSSGNEEEFINIVIKGFDYFSTAYVSPSEYEAALRFLGDSKALAHPRDGIIKRVDQPDRSSSIVQSDSASLLILNEWFTPSWKVRVNGKKQSVLRVNQWQTGVLLGAGKNRVEFEYRPTLFRILMILNRITMVLLVSFLIMSFVRVRWRSTTPRKCRIIAV